MDMFLFDTLKHSIEDIKKMKKFEVKEIRENLEKIEEKIAERHKNIAKKMEEGLEIPQQYEKVLNNVIQSLIVFTQQQLPYDIEAEILKDKFKKCNMGLDTIAILEKLAITKNNIVIVGANGSGKSSLVSFLKASYISDMIVIPAQKVLIYTSESSSFYLKSKQDVNDYQSKDYISSLKQHIDSLDSSYLYSFNILITAIVNDYVDQILQVHSGNKDIEENHIIFNRLKQIWSVLFPHIELNIDSKHRGIYPSLNKVSYNINRLSDGEKSVLYYIGNILMANPDSYIIVDEPETFLNPAMYNKLWDLLIAERQDCQFIFCSHTIDFISSRTNTSIVWSRKFEFPNHWDIELVPDTSLPAPVLVELLGSRKPILFCEGEAKNSYDFQVYSSLFLEEYTIFPAGGHVQVVKHVSSFNSLKALHHNSAIGIIDGDLSLYDEETGDKKEYVYRLPFNEIEMFLLADEVMQEVVQGSWGKTEVESRIRIFKEKFFAEVDQNKEKIALAGIKKMIDTKLECYRIRNKKSFSDIEHEYESLNKLIDIKTEYKKIISTIDQCLSERDYLTLLKICNLKKQISNSLANSYLDSNYITKAINKIHSQAELRQQLKDLYFSELLILLKA
ncbi:AAA family ATPase [Paenibacillus hunanensis]|uniref:DUF4435 domain-containing protein n=1 Tax=Paenibacillus hunanensis TaxID=539262 RepID=UPI0020266D24|nr:DUF4435 domain-containing protein [Paenibacillus hunanensis]MCL9662189.1 AAA family ATPase [Paenibacillus hunanensis]